MPRSPALPIDASGRRYSSVAIILHWVIAALLVGEVALGLRMTGLHGPSQFSVFQLHKSIGVTILLLVLARLLWRFYRPPPEVGAQGLDRTLAYLVHAGFYGLLFALPLSGWAAITTSRIRVPTLLYGLIPWPSFPILGTLATATRDAANTLATAIHVNMVAVLYVLFALHLAGALKHQWVDRDDTIKAMTPSVQPGRIADPWLILIATAGLSAIGLGLWMPLPAVHSVAPAVSAVAFLATVAPPAKVLVKDKPTLFPADPPSLRVAAAPSAVLSSWAIQPGSTLHWQTIWSNETINGGFNRFNGTITFDPDALDRSHVLINIDTTSVFSGDAQRDETLRSADWFATELSPTTTFSAAKFRKTGVDHYTADGKLRLKNTTMPVSVNFTLSIIGDVATMRGIASVDRTAFKIGEGEFAATTDLPAAVALEISITAKR